MVANKNALVASAFTGKPCEPEIERDGFDRFFDRSDLFPAALTITRTSEDDFTSRQLVAYVDGERIATLLWGDSITRELGPGRHVITVHNTLVWKRAAFTLGPGEQVFFEAVNRTGRGTILMTVLFGLGPLYVDLRRMR